MRELAALANSSSSAINQLEKGRTRLNTDWLAVLSKVFGVPPSEIADLEGTMEPAVSDDVVLHEAGGTSARLTLADAQFLYEAKTCVLDQIGIYPGAKLIADASPREMEALSTGDVVIANFYDGPKTTLLLRQFIEPSLLITNSEKHNARIINLRIDDVGIKAVVVSTYSDLKLKKPFLRSG